jgi:flagellar M-ring protein FliF
VVRSESTTDAKSQENQPDSSGQASVAANIPGGAVGAGSGTNSSANTQQESTTNYEISETTRTEVQQPGTVKRLSVAVAVDGLTAPGKDGKPGPYTARSPQEMQQIEQLVRSAIGFNQQRGDQVTVVNVRFPTVDSGEGVTAANPLMGFDKNDIMRAAELGVLAIVALLMMLFIVRPLLKGATSGGGPAPMMIGGPAVTRVATTPDGQAIQVSVDPATGQQLALPGPVSGELEQKIDIARIEGQVKASSLKRVSEFVEKHPEESVSILRSWLHETT